MPTDLSAAPLRRPFPLEMCDLSRPQVDDVGDGWSVVRDDLLPGGTKTRYLPALIHAIADDPESQEVVFAGPAQGALPLALAMRYGPLHRCTLWYPQRKLLAPRQFETLLYGAHHLYSPYPDVRPTIVKKRAKDYSDANGALCIRWSLSYPEVVWTIGTIMQTIDMAYGPFAEVWVAGGGGTLARGILSGVNKVWGKQSTETSVHVVPIGRNMLPREVEGCVLHETPDYAMDRACRIVPPFPCDPYYDAKAWEAGVKVSHQQNANHVPFKRRLFWNFVTYTIDHPQHPHHDKWQRYLNNEPVVPLSITANA